MGWDKSRNHRVRGNLTVSGTSTFTGAETHAGAQTFNGLVTLAAGGTVPAGQKFGVGGTLIVPATIGTVTVPLDGALLLSFGGGSVRLNTKVGGTAYTFLGIPTP